MWLQAVAIILPRVQDEYSVSDARIGLLSASVFCGMMFGALGWGSCSDIVGRSMAFNLTLAFTSLFGVMACFATSFSGLCFLLSLLGSAVGVSTLVLHVMRGIKSLTLSFTGEHAYGWDTVSRKRSKTKAVPPHSFVLLLFYRGGGHRCHSHHSYPRQQLPRSPNSRS